MRKHVTPADPAATIPDPVHADRLPPEGREVEWSAYWAGLRARKDVTVKDVPEPAADPAEVDAATPHAEPDADASA